METLFNRIDLDKSGALDFVEFKRFMSSLFGPMAATLLAVWKVGRIASSELSKSGVDVQPATSRAPPPALL